MFQHLSDAHLHPTDIKEHYEDYSSVEVLMGCAADRKDWEPLSKVSDDRLIRFYGIHPWNSDSWNQDARDELQSIMERDGDAGIGEIGLDSSKGDPSEQLPAFMEQMGIAKEFARPMQIHCIRCEKEVLDAIRTVKPGVPIILHSFKSESYVTPFINGDCYFSINPRVLSMSDKRLRRLMDSVPEDRLLLESDAPFSPNDFTGMGMFIQVLSERTERDPEILSSVVYDNIRRITHG